MNKYPPIDWLLAAILERKKVMGLDWSDIAEVAHVSPDTMRALISKKPPMEWSAEVRAAVLKKLGINARLVIEDEHINGV